MRKELTVIYRIKSGLWISPDFLYFGSDALNTLIPKKHILFALACALFIGCIVGSSRLYNVYTFISGMVLIMLLVFINRKNKKALIIPVLLLVLLWGSFEYGFAASKQGSLQSFAGSSITTYGIVADEPVKTEYGQRFTLKNVYYVNNNKLYKTNEKLFVYGKKDMNVEFGDKIKMVAELDTAAKTRNFGDFDFNKYYQSKNIFMKAYPKHLTRLAANSAGIFGQLLYNCRQRVKQTIYKAMPSSEAAILYGILTGSKSEIDEDVMQVFSMTGLAHILSVSGLHIGFLVLIIGYLLKPLKLKDKAKHIVAFVVVFFYILMIGAPVPALRALLMFTVMLGGRIWGKKYDLNASAAFSAILLLLYNPLLIHDPSFIISFACIYAVVFLHQPINGRLSFLPSWLRRSLSLSLAVWIGITPVLIHYFNYVSFINILLNVAAVPLAFLITLSGFAGVAVGIASPALSLFVFSASYYFIKLLYFISEKALLLPGIGFNVPSLGWHTYVIYYGAVLMLLEDFWKYKLLSFKRRYCAALAAGIAITLIIYLLPGKALRINYLDVGQGDCSVIRTPGNKTIVIDGGGNEAWQSGSYDIGKKITVPALLHIGVWRVDTVIISHIHDDHIGGVLSIIDSFKVSRVILPAVEQCGAGEYISSNYSKLLEKCKIKKISISYLKKGDRIVVNRDITLKVLAPEEPFISSTDSDVNNNSLVIKLDYKDFDALFTGDIQQEAEQRIIEENINTDVLKVAHHGSGYSTTKEFLDLVKPEFSIISVGKNSYGHPSDEAIERLKQANSAVCRTDRCGGVMLKTDGRSLRFLTVR